MPTYTITARPDCGPGHIDSSGRLVFGGTVVAPLARKNRFRLTSRHSSEPGVILFESDIPQLLAYLLDRFQPFNSEITRQPDLPVNPHGTAIAACLAHRVFDDVSGWTSKYCIDCVSQRFRVQKTKEVMKDLIGGNIEWMLINDDDVHSGCYGKAFDLSHDIQDFVLKARQAWREKHPETT